MPKTVIPNPENGTIFATDWEVIRKMTKDECIEAGMGTHNAHFVCRNNKCGTETCMEKTTLVGYCKHNPEENFIVPKCRGCNGVPKKTCYYQDKVRKQVGRDSVTADYSKSVKIGNTYGLFTVVGLVKSKNVAAHQSRPIIKCSLCGTEFEALAHHITNYQVACECFKNHSTGETLIKKYLDSHNIAHRTEQTFDGLYGFNGGLLRYDFAILNPDDSVKALIEFDGEQHFQEAGSYFNKDGTLQARDEMKNQYAAAHNIPLYRIPYTYVNEIDKQLDTIIDLIF